MNFVLDASVTLSWCFEDEGGEYAPAVLDALRSSEAIVASLWPLEVANGLLSAQRRGRLSAVDATRFARLVLSLPIVVDPVDRQRSLDTVRKLANKHNLSAYDAAYLEISSRMDLPLATLDLKLMGAAEAEGVAMFGAPDQSID